MTEWYENPYPKGAAVGPPTLPRVLDHRLDKMQRGPDVRAFKRITSRALRWPWEPLEWDNAYWDSFALGREGGAVATSGIRGFQRQEWREQAAKQTGVLNDETYQRMRRSIVPTGPNLGEPLLDSVAKRLLLEADDMFGGIGMCYPFPVGVDVDICQKLHPTEGLNGNWALDFCANGGSKVVAVEPAKITKLSGRDPDGHWDQQSGIGGWSIHYETTAGYRYFSTHYGSRAVTVGQKVNAGDLVGKIATWPGDPGRSHLHLGVTSPFGIGDAMQRMLDVAKAERVKL